VRETDRQREKRERERAREKKRESENSLSLLLSLSLSFSHTLCLPLRESEPRRAVLLKLAYDSEKRARGFSRLSSLNLT